MLGQEVAVAQLAAWHSFYAIIGSAAATLTGLLFIVVTLMSQMGRLRRSSDALNAFNTPSVVHFAAALGIAALLSAPWPLLWEPAVLLGLAGLAGLYYMRIVIRRTHRQTAYTPVLEDWLWHSIFPSCAYGALVIAALVFAANAMPALFIAGVATLLFLFIGIHNAWDNVTYPIVAGAAQVQSGADQEE
jgi:hypothetical protein